MMDPSLIEQFIAVTGADHTVAVNMLEACAGNLDLAVGMHMDGGSASTSSDGPSHLDSSAPPNLATSSGADNSEDAVRAPIPQKTEVLMDHDPSKFSWSIRRPRRHAASVFDGFRDFQSEAHHYEEFTRGKRPSKRRNLEDLFRPPVDITYKGTFQNARDTGTMMNRWLLVNVQNVQEFPCQTLNRDVWSCANVRDVIKKNFVFWQVYHDSHEGKRYMQFYKLNQWPYIAIIDPFTGENQIEWHKVSDGKVFCELANDFLSTFPAPDQSQLPKAAKIQKREPSIVDATEAEQMEAAIQASLSASAQPRRSSPLYVIESDSDADVTENSDDDVETFCDNDNAVPQTVSDDDDDVVVSTGPTEATNGKHKNKLSKSKVQTTSTSQSQSSLSVRGRSIGNSRAETTSSLSPTPLPTHHSSSSSSSSTSRSPAKQPSTPSKLSRLSRAHSGPGSELRISQRDLMEAGSSSSGFGGSGSSSSAAGSLISSGSSSNNANGVDRHLLPRIDSANNIWSSTRDTDSPLEVNLMDMMGGRDSEVPTPEIVDSSSNSQSPHDGETAAAEEEKSNSQAESWKDYWGDSQDDHSRIMLRFPDNKREQVELPCSSSLQALIVLCASRGFPPDKYELVTNFPRRQLSKLDQSTTVKESGLHPQETVFVQDL